MNRVTLVGRLTKDVVFKTLGSGEPFASFTLAVKRTYKDKDGKRGTDFVPCSCYLRQAEIAKQFCRKGRQIGIDGKIRVKHWDDDKNERHWMTDVVVDEINLDVDGGEGGNAITQDNTIPGVDEGG